MPCRFCALAPSSVSEGAHWAHLPGLEELLQELTHSGYMLSFHKTSPTSPKFPSASPTSDVCPTSCPSPSLVLAKLMPSVKDDTHMHPHYTATWDKAQSQGKGRCWPLGSATMQKLREGTSINIWVSQSLAHIWMSSLQPLKVPF